MDSAATLLNIQPVEADRILGQSSEIQYVSLKEKEKYSRKIRRPTERGDDRIT